MSWARHHPKRVSSTSPLNDDFASAHHPSSTQDPTTIDAAGSKGYSATMEPSPRASDDPGRDPVGDEDAEVAMGAGEARWASTGTTPLDDTLERVGFGRYQKSLLVLCGFGWMCDNATLQAVAIILPRVQVHFGVSDRWIGMMSSSIFCGMMFGSMLFGSLSDAFGRRLPFNTTLLLASVCGFAAALAPSFWTLCLALFCLGVGVGGAMPTDGTLFLENTPPSRHYLLTGLSFFFSLGAVISSILGLLILPGRSCTHPSEGETTPCVPSQNNNGWRYVLVALSLITGFFYVCRVFLFRLHESAKFLVTSGRQSEAVIVLKHISAFNGRHFDISISDIQDGESKDEAPADELTSSSRYQQVAEDEDDSVPAAIGTAAPPRTRAAGAWTSRLPPCIANGIDDFGERVEYLFTPEWRKTTILVWLIWFWVAFGYTCFNVFLPKWLELKLGSDVAGGGGLRETLGDYLLYTTSGCPGSLLGAWMIETSLGRRYSMALSTLLTALGTFVFVSVTSKSGVVLSSMLVSLMSTLMYAVIYGYTPEVFAARSRGTACGLAAALSRVAGISAPMVTGGLLSVSTSLPLYVSSAAFLGSCLCMVALPIETRNTKR